MRCRNGSSVLGRYNVYLYYIENGRDHNKGYSSEKLTHWWHRRINLFYHLKKCRCIHVRSAKGNVVIVHNKKPQRLYKILLQCIHLDWIFFLLGPCVCFNFPSLWGHLINLRPTEESKIKAKTRYMNTSNSVISRNMRVYRSSMLYENLRSLIVITKRRSTVVNVLSMFFFTIR